MTNATVTSRIDNDCVRATEWRLPPGAATGRHRHEHDYVVVPLTGGKLRLVGDEPGEPVTAELDAGHPYFRRAGVEHDVINAGDAEVVFIELELK